MINDTLERRYFFNKWIHGCISDGNLLLLDTKSDQYYFIDNSLLLRLLPSIHTSFKIPADHNNCQIDVSPDVSTIDSMIASGILTTDPQKGKILRQPDVAPPISPFEHIQCDNWPPFRWHHIIAAIYAGLTAYFALRILPLHWIVQNHKAGLRHQSHRNQTSNALLLARIYYQLRPLLIKSRICLYDSLAFSYFCRIYKIYPQIVFGVTGEPFQAHCWAQYQQLILNDVPQNIKKYQPIMAI